MNNKAKKAIILMIAIIAIAGFRTPALAASPTFRLITHSDAADFIGRGESWDCSNGPTYQVSVTEASSSLVRFHITGPGTFSLDLGFASPSGQDLIPGLYSRAMRLPFRGTASGLEISGNGRGCNSLTGAFYVHEYVFANGVVQKAAIDFVQICDTSSDDINQASPRLVGSWRYNSTVPDACTTANCAVALANLHVTSGGSNTTGSSGVPTSTINVSELPKADAYKAIVKVKTFVLDEDYYLRSISEGSGVIINNKGLVLTNYHVILPKDDSGNPFPDAAYNICIVSDPNQPPDCSYTAKLVAANEDTDVALLQIENVAGLNTTNNFPLLTLNTQNNWPMGSEVIALGFPETGRDTITMTKGILSGQLDKAGITWLKTDAAIAFGSSGGAAIDENGQLIGLTSEASVDTVGTLGYIIDIRSVAPWINANKNNSPKASALIDRMISLIQKNKALAKTNKFENNNPPFSITKPNNWQFTYNGENSLAIDEKTNEAGGMVTIEFSPVPYAMDINNVDALFRHFYFGNILQSMLVFSKSEDAVIGGRPAKKFTLTVEDASMSFYLIPVGSYVFQLGYDYGQNNQDKVTVDNIIKSLVLGTPAPLPELTEYANDDLKIYLRGGDGWVFQKKNNPEKPLSIGYKLNKKTLANLSITANNEAIKNLSNEEYAQYLKNVIIQGNVILQLINLKVDFLKSNPQFVLNNELKKVIMTETVTKLASDDQVLSYERTYSIRRGDKIIIVGLSYYGSDKNEYNEVVSKFNKMLSSLSFQGLAAGSTSSSGNNSVAAGSNSALLKKLKGQIILKVEDAGQAYYINPRTLTMHYLGRPDDAFKVMASQGVGIKNADLSKIPVALQYLSGPDTDQDGLPDDFEAAIGTDKTKKDTDGDGHDDKSELANNYNPLGPGKIAIDTKFANSHKGQIFLEVEHKGESWYVNPSDGRRYFLGRPADAFNIMRHLGLGVSNKDFASLE